jgi:hypothetical protein
MPLPLLTSPYKGEETGWRPHKSLKSRISVRLACSFLPHELDVEGLLLHGLEVGADQAVLLR